MDAPTKPPELIELQRLLSDEAINCADIARIAGVSYKTVMNIKSGRSGKYAVTDITVSTYRAIKNALETARAA